MKPLLLFFLVFYTSTFYAQEETKANLLSSWKNTQLNDSIRAENYFKLISKYYQQEDPSLAKTMADTLYQFTQKKELINQKTKVELMLGNLEYNNSNIELSLNYYKKALESSKSNPDLKNEAKALSNIGQIYSLYFKYDKALDYLEKAKKIAKQSKDTSAIAAILMNIGNVYGNKFQFATSNEYYSQSIELYKALNDEINQAKIYSLIGDNEDRSGNFNKSKKYYFRSLKVFREHNDIQNERQVLFSLSSSYLSQKLYDSCIYYGKTREKIDQKLSPNIYSVTNYYNLSDAYKATGSLKNAFEYLEKATSIESQLQQFNANKKLQNIEIKQIKTKDSLINVAKTYQTNLKHQKEKTKLTLFWGGILALVSTLAFLLFRNTKRKQRKAEEERQKQIDEKEKILKELELSTIDAMILGQEKERQRLASDLHDSVGATLSAAKLQFEHLIKDEIDTKAREELINKTSTLLEDAYVEIRSMAHLKNSGVIAKNGLLPAVAKLAESASGVNSLKFEVQSHGLEERIDNSLEISIFRIIQELVTNVIKHANATKGIIHLTNHDETINIMVEDNGKGFNPNQVTKTKAGMGISSIDKRVEHLDGKLTIESEKDKGTTVIIDIPL